MNREPFVVREQRSGAPVALDVQALPLVLTNHLVHRRSKRLPPAARAFRRFPLSDGAHLTDQILPVR